MGKIRVMIPQLMAEQGMNITDLKNLLEVSWPTAQKLASGNPTVLRPKQLEKLCEVFGVQPGDILEYHPQKSCQ